MYRLHSQVPNISHRISMIIQKKIDLFILVVLGY